MKKLSKTAKTVIIAVAVPIALAAAAVILLITLPRRDNGDDNSVNVSLVEEQVVPINTKNADDVNFLAVSNENGDFTFKRQKRTTQIDTESGETVSKDEFYWTSDELLDVPQDDSAVRSFIAGLAQLSGVSVVEENADDLEKYGLDPAAATVRANLDDGTTLKMHFGIRNPANDQTVYFRLSDSRRVYLVSYFAAANAFSDVRKFAVLTLTESYSSEMNNELDYLRITRADMKSPVEIRFVHTRDAPEKNEAVISATLNTHRFITPVTCEVDSAGRGHGISGKSLCYGVYALKMDSCEYLEKSYENLRACGLDKPFARVEFKYGGREYSMTLSAADANRKICYAALQDVPGIYSISCENAPWCSFTIENLIPARPLSPYIRSLDSVDISHGESVYNFAINGEGKSFTCNGEAVGAESFRSFYRQLIGEIGEEVYLTQVSAEETPEVTVTFTYKPKYAGVYDRETETLEFFSSDGRKCKVNLNGKTLYKVSDNYVKVLLENLQALSEGGEVNAEWKSNV